MWGVASRCRVVTTRQQPFRDQMSVATDCRDSSFFLAPSCHVACVPSRQPSPLHTLPALELGLRTGSPPLASRLACDDREVQARYCAWRAAPR
eukprot:2839893-Prymnesium_polylepis.1